MTHRDQNVWLDPAEARCSPSLHTQCGRWTCARYRAMIPAVGGTVADFNHNRTANDKDCPHWLSAEQKRPAAAVESRPVFKSLRGI